MSPAPQHEAPPVAQSAQAGARHFDRTTFRIDENERIEVRLLVQQAPDVGFKLERFVLQAMILGIVMTQDLAARRVGRLFAHFRGGFGRARFGHLARA